MSMYAEKGNKVIEVGESDVQRYLSQGFTITDGKGTVLQEAVPTDTQSLWQAYHKHIAEIASLKKTVAELQGKIETLETLEKAKKVEIPKAEKVEESEEKPRRRSTKVE